MLEPKLVYKFVYRKRKADLSLFGVVCGYVCSVVFMCTRNPLIFVECYICGCVSVVSMRTKAELRIGDRDCRLCDHYHWFAEGGLKYCRLHPDRVILVSWGVCGGFSDGGVKKKYGKD